MTIKALKLVDTFADVTSSAQKQWSAPFSWMKRLVIPLQRQTLTHTDICRPWMGHWGTGFPSKRVKGWHDLNERRSHVPLELTQGNEDNSQHKSSIVVTSLQHPLTLQVRILSKSKKPLMWRGNKKVLVERNLPEREELLLQAEGNSMQTTCKAGRHGFQTHADPPVLIT